MAKLTMLGQFVQELEKGTDGKPYDFIALHYSKMTKEELSAIIKEFIWAVNESNRTGNSVTFDDVAENIREWNFDSLEVED